MFLKARKNSKFKNPGLTLIELLVAMVIGSLMLILVMESYWVMMQTYFQVEASRDLQRETRFAMTRMTDKIRANSIDYAGYEAGAPADRCPSLDLSNNATLCLTGDHHFQPDGEIKIEHDTADKMVYLVSKANSTRQPLLSPNKFEVTNFNLKSTPGANPFNYALENQMQPKTTIFMEVASKKEGFENVKISVQTTVSSRVYSP